VKVTVVIAATASTPLERCLRSLERECPVKQVELILAHKRRPELVEAARRLGFSVQSIECATGMSIFAMRKAAMAYSTGDLVASIGERYTLPAGWIAEVESSGDWDVLTGCVVPPPGLSNTGWSIYLAEYSHLATPLPSGLMNHEEAARSAGGNIVYRGTLARGIPENTEMAFHSRLSSACSRFVRSEDLTAEFASPPSLPEYLKERYWLSVDWGKHQAIGRGEMWKVAMSLSRLALPPILLVRRSLSVWRARQYRRRLFIALPYFVFYSFVEMAGEITGLLDKDQRVP
jgi:hypothetical protein